ncbi:ABC transporter permease [Georgenia yuyongxinii]|uniref:ABC transporter permease n=2 Tax=Georgenia yuyongxinii TaxID=2589797 RepID=A0A552WY15_9MICO|nr:ABC transporter permease [Georgenia yuyongxinii]QDC26755.1 ABC transporter permease [Georgenia yuyongxinii]TRW47575.1 ABC transporter permease [Georgenia yuyongxinii]
MSSSLLYSPARNAPGSTLPTPAPRKARPRRLAGLLVLPACIVLAVFFLYPLALIIWRSFSEPSLGFANYVELFTNESSLKVLLRTFLTALAVSTITLVMAYPYAYMMTRVNRRTRAVLMAIAMLPFWMSLMARTFAWVVLLGHGGPVAKLFALFGMDDVVLLGTVWGVVVGTVQVLLPYMILTLYGTMQGIDMRLVDAAKSLGATPRSAFRRVYLPLSLPGVAAGYTLVFVISLGFYITPRILGSPQQSLIAQVIGIRVERLLDFGGAGAMSVLLLVLTALLLIVVSRVSGNRKLLEGGS